MPLDIVFAERRQKHEFKSSRLSLSVPRGKHAEILIIVPRYGRLDRNYSPLTPEAARVPIPVAGERAAQPSTIGPPVQTGAESRRTFCRRRHAGAYIYLDK